MLAPTLARWLGLWSDCASKLPFVGYARENVELGDADRDGGMVIEPVGVKSSFSLDASADA